MPKPDGAARSRPCRRIVLPAASGSSRSHGENDFQRGNCRRHDRLRVDGVTQSPKQRNRLLKRSHVHTCKCLGAHVIERDVLLPRRGSGSKQGLPTILPHGCARVPRRLLQRPCRARARGTRCREVRQSERQGPPVHRLPRPRQGRRTRPRRRGHPPSDRRLRVHPASPPQATERPRACRSRI